MNVPVPSLLMLNIDQVESRPDIDSRRLPNPAYPDIKESIRLNGVDNAIVVTKTPGQLKYFVKKGGNTRLRCLRELWEETQDKRYYIQQFIFEPWIDEADEFRARVASASENINRGDLAFIEQAEFFVKLRNDINALEGKELSLRDCCIKIHQYGFKKIDSGTLSRYLSAVRLYPYMTYAFDEERIGKKFFEKILRLEKILLEYVTKNVAIELHPEFYEGWHQCLQNADERGDVGTESLQNAMEEWLAQWLGANYIEVVTDIKAITFGIPHNLSFQDELSSEPDEIKTTSQLAPTKATLRASQKAAGESDQLNPVNTRNTPKETGAAGHAAHEHVRQMAHTSTNQTADAFKTKLEHDELDNYRDEDVDESDENQNEYQFEHQAPTKITPSESAEWTDIVGVRTALYALLVQLLNHFPILQSSLFFDERGPYILPPTTKLSLTSDEIYIWWHIYSAVNCVLDNPFVSVPNDAIVDVFGDHEEFGNFIFRSAYAIARFESEIVMCLDEITQLMRAASRMEQ